MPKEAGRDFIDILRAHGKQCAKLRDKLAENPATKQERKVIIADITRSDRRWHRGDN